MNDEEEKINKEKNRKSCYRKTSHKFGGNCDLIFLDI